MLLTQLDKTCKFKHWSLQCIEADDLQQTPQPGLADPLNNDQKITLGNSLGTTNEGTIIGSFKETLKKTKRYE